MKSILLKNRLIYSQFFKDLIKDKPIVFADIGARGGLSEP
jgi:hypothetical protein